jgi:HD-GYP domain-containing protein (c-di-GMP phosphodiesterase class II)
MNNFQKQTALRIAAVSVVLATLASSMAWFVSRENAEEGIVLLATEESGRLLHHFDAIDLSGPEATAHAGMAAKTIVGGLFDIAEIYDPSGKKLAEAMTGDGKKVEVLVPRHGSPNYKKASYDSLKLGNTQWALRVFVPLRNSATDMSQPITGYFEGVRLVPEWQSDQILASSLTAAGMAALAALLCGLAIYPMVVHLSKENERKTREVLDSHISMMEALGRAIAKRDSDTGAHNYRVSWIASGMGELMGLTGSAMQSLIAGSFLHDVGKIGIPDAILLKPGKLDEAEFKTMRTHVSQGEEIVTGMGWLDGANAIVAAHHEKWNGSGYPRGLKGEDIPLSARIFAVADVFDALCSKRPYKEPMSLEAAMAILEKDTGSHFDPAVMAVFRPIATAVYQRLENTTEDDARNLLEARVRKHFD